MDIQLLRVGEAAQALNVSCWTIYRWVEEGRLEATKIGKGSLRNFQRVREYAGSRQSERTVGTCAIGFAVDCYRNDALLNTSLCNLTLTNTTRNEG